MNQENTSAPAENKMGTMPIGKLLFNMSLPMMISMLVQALYNIVDSIFVAKLSENALTAVSLAFPLQTLLIAVGTGTGVGMNALLSKSLGEKNFKKANATASNAAVLYFFSYLVFFILGFTIVRPFYASQIGNADQEIMKLGIEYLSPIIGMPIKRELPITPMAISRSFQRCGFDADSICPSILFSVSCAIYANTTHRNTPKINRCSG